MENVHNEAFFFLSLLILGSKGDLLSGTLLYISALQTHAPTRKSSDFGVFFGRTVGTGCTI